MIINFGPVQDYSNFSEYPRVTTELKKVDLFISVEKFVVALFQFLMVSFYRIMKKTMTYLQKC